MDAEINESNRIYIWKLYLSPDDSEEVILTTEYDLHNQRVIKTDSERTRNMLITEDERDLLEQILTTYCKNENVSYKQGMNEVLSPFLLLGR
jgi:hypothetical protein